MLNRTNIILVIVVSVVLFTTCGMQGTAVAQKTTVQKSQGQPVLGADEVKQLLLLMDNDRDGKVSKQEWMTFMEAEFVQLSVLGLVQSVAISTTLRNPAIAHRRFG